MFCYYFFLKFPILNIKPKESKIKRYENQKCDLVLLFFADCVFVLKRHSGLVCTVILLYIIHRSTNVSDFHECILRSPHSLLDL